MPKKVFIVVIFSLSFCINTFAQVNKPNHFIEWTTWTLLQTIPSPTYFHDNKDNNSRLVFGFKWNVIPFSYSFKMNRLIPKVHLFKVNPLHRHSGSLEVFLQPELSLKDYTNSGQKRFSFSTGSRLFLPLVEYGEYLSFSIGGKYSFRKDVSDNNMNAFGLEAGIYSLFGIAGLQFTYNFTKINKYNISLYIKYY